MKAPTTLSSLLVSNSLNVTLIVHFALATSARDQRRRYSLLDRLFRCGRDALREAEPYLA
jgi:hypothetical protein